MAGRDFMAELDAKDLRAERTPDVTTDVVNSLVKNSTQQATTAPAARFNAAKDSQSAYENMAGQAKTNILAFTPNLLDSYDTYTYHWKLFIVPLPAAAAGAVLDQDIQTIIAESGVSDLTIDKVEIMGITTPSIESGTGTQTTLKFEIVEPSGAGLIDKIYYETISLGIGNWMVSPYYIQLEFRGRDPDTSETVNNNAPGGLGSLKWVWPMKLTNAKINVTEVGTRYEFEAIFYDEIALTNAYASIQHSITLNNITDFASAMGDLQNKLNADAFEKLIENYSIPDTYTIVVDPALGKRQLVDQNSNKNTARGSDYVNFSKKTATFAQGTGIDKIVDCLLGATVVAQTSLQQSNTPSSKPNTQGAEADQMRKFWRIVTETRPIEFDPLRQDNAVAMTIYIVEYNLGLLEATAAQTGQMPNDAPAALRRIKEYAGKRVLRKKYNYIYTGLNDQIVALDLNMNYSFAAATARFGGIYIDSQAGQTKGVVTQDNADNEKKAGDIARQTLQFLNNATSDQKADALIAEAKAKIQASKISADKQANLISILNQTKPSSRAALLASRNTNQSDSLIAAAKSAKSLAGDNTNLKFISDVNPLSAASQGLEAQARKTAQSLGKGKLRPIPLREQANDGNLTGIDPASNSGRARTSSLFATALYSNLDGSMQQLKMTIKGDPFWLFPRGITAGESTLRYRSNMSNSDAIRDIKQALVAGDTNESVNILGSDNFIVLRFRTPRIFNNTTDPDDPFTEVQTFSGVYKVIRIINKFAGGRFTQDIEGILDPLLDITNDTALADFIKSLGGDIDKPPTKPQPAPDPGIDKTNITTQRILAGAPLPPGQVVNTLNNPIPTITNSLGGIGSQLTSNIPTVSPGQRLAFEQAKNLLS